MPDGISESKYGRSSKALCRAKVKAIALPIPLLPPVTNAAFPRKSIYILLVCLLTTHGIARIASQWHNYRHDNEYLGRR